MGKSMKDSGLSWIKNIPEHWRIMPNKYVMYKVKDIQDIYKGEDILSLSTEGVKVRDLDAGGKMPTTFDGYQKVKPGNLLMCLFDIDVTPRCIGIIKDEGLTSPAYSQFVMRDIGYAPYFYYYYLNLDYDKTLVHLAKNLRHSLTEEQLGWINVPVPPLEEQQTIAEFLDKKTTEIDSAIYQAKRLIDEYKLYKQSVISESVTRGINPNARMKNSGVDWIGMIPQEWKTKKGKYLFTLRNERGNKIELQLLSPTQKYGCIPQTLYEELTTANTVKLNDKTDLNLLKTIHVGDFCISLRSFQGGFEYSNYEGVVSPAYQVFFPESENLHRGYYKYLFKEQSFIAKMNSYTLTLRDGKTISFTDDFGITEVPIPPIEEQEVIANYLDQKCSQIDSIIEQKEQLIVQLQEYKKSIIFEYVTGKKEVPNG